MSRKIFPLDPALTKDIVKSRLQAGMKALKHSTSKILYKYWNDIRAGRPAPKRFEVEPATIGTILPQTFMLERIDAQCFRFRLAGTKICEQFGREFRGVNFLDLWADSDRITLERQFASMCKDLTVGVATFNAASSQGQTVTFEIVMLPLFHTRSVVTRVLGAISVADAPHWLGEQTLVSQSLTDNEIIWPQDRAPVKHKDVFRNQAAAQKAPEGRVVRFDRRQFRVYDGGLSKLPVER